MITISESAAKKIDQLKKEEGAGEEAALRVQIKKGGCSGFNYKMEFEEGQGEGDKIFESNGAKILVDSQSLLYLIGLTLDFEGGLNGKGFTFANPNATKTCGCGTSFAV